MHWFGPMPGSREARALSWMAITAGLIVCALSILRGFQGQTFMGRPLGGDFVQFYTVGEILNQYQPARIYDLDLEIPLQHAAAPGAPHDQMLVFASAPYAAQIYRPFALLPYAWAYIAWLVFSMALYAAAVMLLLSSARLTAAQKQTGFLLAISFMPFLMESWIGGQISIVAFFAVALFVFLRSRNRRFLAGLALALALFKPTLIAIPILMLLIGRRWRMLAGVAAGAASLAVVSIATVGMEGCARWIGTLQFYGHLATGSAAALRRMKYVDAGSFFHLLIGNSAIAQILGVLAPVAGIAILAVAWWRSSGWDAPSRDLLWAATFAGALVSNVYTPIYDSILIAPAVALAAGVMLKRGESEREMLAAWMVLLYIVPWLTQSFAEFLRFQPFTLVLAGFAWWVLGQARLPAATRPVLGVTSYIESFGTRNFSRRLSVLLRSYSPLSRPTMGTR